MNFQNGHLRARLKKKEEGGSKVNCRRRKLDETFALEKNGVKKKKKKISAIVAASACLCLLARNINLKTHLKRRDSKRVGLEKKKKKEKMRKKRKRKL